MNRGLAACFVVTLWMVGGCGGESVPATQTGPQPVPAPPAVDAGSPVREPLRFSPVRQIDRDIAKQRPVGAASPGGDSPDEDAYCLEAGTVVKIPKGLNRPETREQFQAHLSEHKIDAIPFSSEPDFGILLLWDRRDEVLSVRLESGDWDTMSAHTLQIKVRELLDAGVNLKDSIVSSTTEPRVYAFRSRRRIVGMIRLTGYDNAEALGVRIEIKSIESAP